MIVKINGRELESQGFLNFEESYTESPKLDSPPTKRIKINADLSKVRRLLLPVTTGLSLLSRTSTVMAATPARGVADNLMPIVSMLQDFAFPVGLGIGIWGLIEYIMDNPAGKEKVKKAIIGYIGIFVLPSIFNAIRDAFNR